MTPEEFARCLACWMSPGVLARAAGDWSERPKGHEPARLLFGSPILGDAAEARFDWFFRRYLEHVHIPEELIRFTHGMYPRYVTAAAADWLRGFRFTGEIEFNPKERPEGRVGAVLAAITAPVCEIRVVWPPLNMLSELISVKAKYWRDVAAIAHPSQIHHEPRGEWPFEVWMDLQVARACGFPAIGRAGAVSPFNRVTNVRGHVSIAGTLPRNDDERALFSHAACLRPTTRSRTFDLAEALKKRRRK